MSSKKTVELSARDTVSNFLLEQILGTTEASLFSGQPLPQPDEKGKVHIKKSLADSAFHDSETGFTVLQNTRPEMVFGTGILHSPVTATKDPAESGDASADYAIEEDSPFKAPGAPDLSIKMVDDPSEESSDIDQSQKIRPSAMGLTAQFVANPAALVSFQVSAATYSAIEVELEEYGSKTWFRRNAHSESIDLAWSELSSKPNKLLKYPLPGVIGEYSELQIRWRPTSSSNEQGSQLLALTAVVAHRGEKPDDLFQFQLKLSVTGGGMFSSPDKTKSLARQGLEEQEVEFLYRHVNSFANGHGISVGWDESQTNFVTEIWTESIPTFFQEQIEPKIDGISIEMLDLYEGSSLEIKETLQKLVDGYEDWILSNSQDFSHLPGHQKVIGERLAMKATHLKSRMQAGLDLLFSDGNGLMLEAFRLTNRAMYLQQQHGKIERREFNDKKGEKLTFDKAVMPEPGTYGSWRPFQIGFLLMTLPGLVNPLDENREEVDLIFFPTGGGKTEAYLGAAALSILFRRLTDREHSGVDVLMRYTLRLLTVQQFERSSGLIAALEHMRRESPSKLGDAPISIGVWLGDKTTPNKRDKALEILAGRGNKEDSTHPFVLSKCPWCGAAFAIRESNKTWVGYKKATEKPLTIRFICGDDTCDFSRESTALPIWITDEDVYDFKPSFVLGTVDKFAQIAWQPKARALFNIGDDGNRIGLPPNLIIQDELHLISGPLGSLVGLYETVIDELCTYEVDGQSIKAKIISSTATTKNYQSQISALYGRGSVALFPQAVSRANETYFSRVKRVDGVPTKGTAYLGINPATYATGQLAASQVSAFLSQAPNAWGGSSTEIDYYATSMWFFNSLKELGQTLTLMQSTVVSLLNSMWRDRRLPGQKTRYLDPIMELTGRVSSAQVSKALNDLNVQTGKPGSIHTCLASSIMEVGVDVQRLGLLTIMSQPKLTAQYIQVSGRVGRNTQDGPGLVVMLYNSNRARDRSVYEHFGNYHRRLYAQVEPLSVTPFAIQTMEKGLAGAIIALYRMTGAVDASPTHLDLQRFEQAADVFRRRIEFLNSSNARMEDFERQIKDLRDRWTLYQPTKWAYDFDQETKKSDSQATALLRRRPEALGHIDGDSSITIPQSMRTVDGQTNIVPSANVYNFLAGDKD
jgi:hypothetical protein